MISPLVDGILVVFKHHTTSRESGRLASNCLTRLMPNPGRGVEYGATRETCYGGYYGYYGIIPDIIRVIIMIRMKRHKRDGILRYLFN